MIEQIKIKTTNLTLEFEPDRSKESLEEVRRWLNSFFDSAIESLQSEKSKGVSDVVESDNH